jgi:hypothetical protein
MAIKFALRRVISRVQFKTLKEKKRVRRYFDSSVTFPEKE